MPGKRPAFDKEVRTGSAGGVSSTFADDPVDGFGYRSRMTHTVQSRSLRPYRRSQPYALVDRERSNAGVPSYGERQARRMSPPSPRYLGSPRFSAVRGETPALA